MARMAAPLKKGQWIVANVHTLPKPALRHHCHICCYKSFAASFIAVLKR